MLDREKELRTKIAAECLQNGHKSDYLTACSENYDFVRCPDEFNCLEEYIQDFSAICDELGCDLLCVDCWKRFLRGEEC